MFLVLGLLVFPSQLWGVALEGTVLALVLVFVARPVATFVATAGSAFDARERVVLSWGGLRGAVPVVLATFPVIASVSEGFEFFNIVFFAVLVSTLLQGSTFEPLARRLQLTGDPGTEAAPPQLAGRLRSTAQISTSRPWHGPDGDPSYPREIEGVPVEDQLLTRVDRAGALVSLADGRYAFTGPIVAIGSTTALQSSARRRLAASTTEADRNWWREVIGALARGAE
jgi:hypothetical protein